MRKQQELERLSATIHHSDWTNLSSTKDFLMSVDHGSRFSDAGLSLNTDCKVTFPVQTQAQREHVKDHCRQKPPEGNSSTQLMSLLDKQTHQFGALDEKIRSPPINVQLIPKTEFNGSWTETKATSFVTISTNSLLEIKPQRQSILNKHLYNEQVLSVAEGNQELTQVVDFTLAKKKIFGIDVNANKEEYAKVSGENNTQSLCNVVDRWVNLGTNLAITNPGSSLGEYEQVEVLDLSLPKIKDRTKEHEYEGSLHMEVDEIEDELQQVEVVQDDDDGVCWSPLYHPHNMDLSLSSFKAIQTPSYSRILTSDPVDALLIDDQGIPYTLTPDGQKVLQIQDQEQNEDTPSSFANVVTDSRLQKQPSLLFADGSVDPVSVEASELSLNLELNSTDNPTFPAKSTISSTTDLASIPNQNVVDSTGTNAPILFVPPSQLQSLSSPASEGNPGLITLSLPVPLNQNSQSNTMFLVLSTPQISSIQYSSGKESETSSSSRVSLPLSSRPLLSCSTISSDRATNSSGLNNPANLPSSPTSLTVSSSTSTVTSSSQGKQLPVDVSNLPVPTSFREALLRLAVSVEKKQDLESPSVGTPSSSSATALPDSSTSAHENRNHETEENCDGDLESVDQKDFLESTSSTSPLDPGSPSIPKSHPNNQDPRRILYCKYCPRIFYYLSDLERHSITHSQSKPHVCLLCDKAFKRSSHLERHKHIHTGQRNFVCQLCPRRFRESGELIRHQRVHTGEKPYQCLICHMRFAERNTLRRHTKRKHQGQQLETMDVKAKPVSGNDTLVCVQGESEDNEEWYSSKPPQMESDSDTGGEGTS